MAGGLGFEPRLTESESAVLPLNYPPIVRSNRFAQTGLPSRALAAAGSVKSISPGHLGHIEPLSKQPVFLPARGRACLVRSCARGSLRPSCNESSTMLRTLANLTHIFETIFSGARFRVRIGQVSRVRDDRRVPNACHRMSSVGSGGRQRADPGHVAHPRSALARPGRECQPGTAAQCPKIERVRLPIDAARAQRARTYDDRAGQKLNGGEEKDSNLRHGRPCAASDGAISHSATSPSSNVDSLS